MPSTHTNLVFHVIFSTRNREPMIAETWRPRLHKYLAGIVVGLDGTPQCVGGVADHVHLLVGLKPTHRLSDFMRDLKKSSSAWVTEEIEDAGFSWQEGYAAFSVSASASEAVWKYIDGQEEHHRRKTFREELVEFLEKSGVKYDPRYLV